MVMNMEINSIYYDKKNNANKYLIGLLVGGAAFVLLSVIYLLSGKLALSVKYPDLIEITEDSNEYYQLLSVVQFLYQVPLVCFFIFLFGDDLKKELIDLKNNKKYLLYIVIGLVSCLVLTALMSIVYELFGIVDTSENQETIDKALVGSGGVFMALSVALTAPFVEEMIFRKSFCDTLKYKFNVKDVITIILSTFLFSFVHVASIDNLIFIFQYIPLALVIVLSYYFTKNIYVSIGIHLLNNVISLVATYLLLFYG